MGPFPQKLLTAALLAIYSAISLLGYGLHSLAPHAGHHHGVKVVECATHRGDQPCDCAFHRRLAQQASASAAAASTETIVTASGCACCGHDCHICTFLAQALSTQPRAVAPGFWQPLVTKIRPTGDAPWFESVSRGSHVPRGPPLLAV